MAASSPSRSNPVLADFDPLAGPPAPSAHNSIQTHDSAIAHDDADPSNAPITFKRRTASRGITSRTGLLGSILSKNDQSIDKVPPILQPQDNAQSSASASTSAATARLTPADGDRPTEPSSSQQLGSSAPGQGGRWPHRLRALSGASRSTRWGAGGADVGPGGPMRSPSRVGSRFDSRRPSSPGGGRQRLLSPGGGNIRLPPDGEGEDDDFLDDATPLPTIPILVLCIAMFGEFLCASTSSPFLYFMIEDFGVGQGPGGGGEAAVGFWAGIVSCVFFLSQFLTSLLWVSVAEKHGRRAVLFSSLLGNAVTLALFGTSKNLGSAICIRLGMGVFNGAVGVARSAVQSITDPTNESRAFTYMGLSWGLGGIVGSIVGGLAENPVRNHPTLFGESKLFAEYPYLLPCLISSSVTFTGALLSTFLNRDGGPRDRGIRLPTEKDIEQAAQSAFSIPSKIINAVTSYVAPHHKSASSSASVSPDRVALHRANSVPGQETEDVAPLDRPIARKASQYGSAFQGFNPLSLRRASAATRASGSAYGYAERPRYASIRRNTNTGSQFRVMSVGTSTRYAPDYDQYEGIEEQQLNFAERLLLANEPAVFSLSELWVTAATRADEQMAYTESVFEDEDDVESRIGIDEAGEEPDFFGYGSAPPSIAPSTEDLRAQARLQDEPRGRPDTSAATSGANTPARPSSPSLGVPPLGGGALRSPSRGYGPQDRAVSVTRESERDRDQQRVFSYGGGRFRRGSTASSARGPALFANTGLDPSSLGMASPGINAGPKAGLDAAGESAFNPMAAIPEQRAPSIVEVDVENQEEEKTQEGLIRQLPLAMIAQYALVALHGTTCDQIFLSFIVTPIASGGLGLKAAHYAILVAMMFFFQTLWQFRFYPFVCAPRGPLSHLAMFRLGLALYIPVYILFPELRGLLSEKSNFGVMFAMTLLSSIRYLASTCAYTAVMVLINAMSPPHLVPLANGLAQSAVSLARFVGPLMGGTMWAASISSGPNAHPYPFNYAAGFVAIGLLCGIGLLHSFRIH